MQQYIDSDENVYLDEKCGCGRIDVVLRSEEHGRVVYSMASFPINATITLPPIDRRRSYLPSISKSVKHEGKADGSLGIMAQPICYVSLAMVQLGQSESQKRLNGINSWQCVSAIRTKPKFG